MGCTNYRRIFLFKDDAYWSVVIDMHLMSDESMTNLKYWKLKSKGNVVKCIMFICYLYAVSTILNVYSSDVGITYG